MKKFYLFILLSVLLVSFNSCKSDITGSIADSNMPEAEGWYDNNSCGVIGNGYPEQRVQSVILKRVAARENALINAKELMLEFLVNTYLEHNSSGYDYDSVKSAFSKNYSGLIKNGIVTHEKYSGDDSCRIIFAVSRNNLKKEIMSGTVLK
ncbi:MAG: hypothetical protein CVV49_20260 [Spirochaetae bacterium HGW-Spirochaetae-5]|nr:MAG: hypothetical protein CVV49_20260 [Spirochaetae bacterium HGW-Spirochaetae-5]